MVSGFDEGYNTTIITKLLIGIMNKRTILIGSLCIVLLLIGVLYVMKTNEGFVDPPAGAALIAAAKQAIVEATAANAKALAAVNTANEISTAKEAFDKATAAVAAANAAVSATPPGSDETTMASYNTNLGVANTQLTDARTAEGKAKKEAEDAEKAYKTAFGAVKTAQNKLTELQQSSR